MATPTYLTSKDVARLLDLTPGRVSQLVGEGRLQPGIRLNREMGFTLADVEELRQARKRVGMQK